MAWFKPTAVAAAQNLVWGDADLNNAASQSGVTHENYPNTDNTDASVLKQGYEYSSPLATPTTSSSLNYHAANGVSVPHATENMWPAALYDAAANNTYVVWIGPNVDPYANQYDHDTNNWAGVVQVGDSAATNDHHGQPVLWQDSNDYLHSVYGPHGDVGTSVLSHSKADSPNDATSWTQQTDILSDPANVTYPTAYTKGAETWLFFRHRNTGGTANKFAYMYSSSDGDQGTWGSLTDLIDISGGPDGGDIRIYPFGKARDGDTVWFSLVFRYNQDTVEFKEIYVVKYDLVNDTLSAYDDTSLSTPVSYTSMQNNALVLDTTEGTFSTAMDLDQNGVPHITYGYDNSGNGELRYINYVGGSWSSPTTIDTIGYERVGGSDIRAHSDTDIDVYAKKNVSSSGERGGDIVLYNYDGGSWSTVKTVYDENNWGEGASDPQFVKNRSDLVSFPQTDGGDFSNSDLKMFMYDGQGYLTDDVYQAARWPLHEDSGPATDVYGSKNSTAVSATQGETGLLGTTAYSFTASNSEIVEFDNSTLGIANGAASPFTLWAWIYWTGSTSGAEGVLRGPSDQNNPPGNPVYGLFIADGSPRVYYQSNSNNFVGTAKTGSVPQSGWRFLAGTYDASTLTCYLSDGTGSLSTIDSISTTAPVYDATGGEPEGHKLGVLDESAGSYFDGRIWDAGIDSQAYTQAQLQDMVDVVKTSGSLITDAEVK